jgi:hypothetical protein
LNQWAQLIYGPTDQHLWANSYERDLQDVLALQAEVAGDIAQQIEAKVTPEEQVRVATVSRCSPQAHDLVLQAMRTRLPARRTDPTTIESTFNSCAISGKGRFAPPL